MTSKQIVIDLVRRLPDELSIAEIAREVKFLAGVREAIDEFDQGAALSAQELLREIALWAKATE